MTFIQNKKWIIIGASMLFLSISLGAFAAHGLKKFLSIESIKSFQIGVTYQFYHSISILTLIGIQNFINVKFLLYALRCMLLGVICFSGSIYVLSVVKISSATEVLPDFAFVKIIIFLTPIGGIFFLLSWFFVLLGTIRKKI